MRYAPLFVTFLFVGCALMRPHEELSRSPASTSPGGLNDEELNRCDGTECKYFIAPCDLKEARAPNSTRYVSLQQEAYLRQMDEYDQRGFCQLDTRHMPNDLYGKNSCIFVFIKRDGCTP